MPNETIMLLINCWNDSSMEPLLSWPVMETIGMSSTIAVGTTARAGAVASDSSSKIIFKEVNMTDLIASLLGAAIGPSSTDSISSNISIQRPEGLVSLDYPENFGYTTVEINIATHSEVQGIESREAWKAYDFRIKHVVKSPLEKTYIKVINLIRNITERYQNRENFKRTVFKPAAVTQEQETMNFIDEP